MRRLAASGLSAWSAFTHSNQSSSSTFHNAVAAAFRRCLSTNGTTSAVSSRGTGRKAPASESGGSPWTPFSVVLFIPSVVCGCLAYWQYERLKWKEQLIQLRQGIAEAEAKDIFAGVAPLHEYDKVKVRGHYLHEYSLFVGPRPRNLPGSGIQPGYIVITPMITTDRKGVVLVNRGWVPTAWKNEAEVKAAAKIQEAATEAKEKATATTSTTVSTTTASTASGLSPKPRSWWSWLVFGNRGGASQPPISPSSGSATPKPVAKLVPEPEVVIGVIQSDEQPSNFMPDNKPESEEFHYIQRETMARVLGLPPDTPLVMAISTDPSAAQSVQKRSPLEEKRSAAAAAAAAASTADASGPSYPAPKHVADLVRFSTMPGDHLNYALIWATLCVTLAFMARTAIVKPLRGPRIIEEPGTSARDAWKASQAN